MRIVFAVAAGLVTGVLTMAGTVTAAGAAPTAATASDPGSGRAQRAQADGDRHRAQLGEDVLAVGGADVG